MAFIRTPIYSTLPKQTEQVTVSRDVVTDSVPIIGLSYIEDGSYRLPPEDLYQLISATPVETDVEHLKKLAEASRHRRSTGAIKTVAVQLANQQARDQERDGYLEKLLKYVPIEVSSLFVSFVALAVATNQIESVDGKEKVKAVLTLQGYELTPVLLIFWGFFLLTPIYFFVSARRIKEPWNRPTWWFYLLSPVAFTVWSMAISDQIRLTFGRGKDTTALLLAAGAILIPLADELATIIFGDKSPTAEEVEQSSSPSEA